MPPSSPAPAAPRHEGEPRPRPGTDSPPRRGRLQRGRAVRLEHRRAWPYPETFTPGNDVRVFHQGGPCFGDMLRAIAAAGRTVHLETYLLRSDRTGWEFARALAAKADQGVEVALMFDGVGGMTVSREYLDFLAAHGVPVVTYHPLWPWQPRWGLVRRNHRKILVVDGRIGFVGGMNLSDHHVSAVNGGEDWRDTHLRVEGPAAAALDRLFVEEWVRQGGRRLTDPAPPAPRAGGVPVRVVENRHVMGRARLRGAYMDALRFARRRIWIVSGYFVPDRRFVRALVRAARRGADVRIVVAGRSDVRSARWAGQHLYERLLSAGVRLFEWTQTVLHAKTAIVDEQWVTIGTYNLDHRSLRYNLEVNAMVLDREVASRMASDFLEDQSRSVELDLATWRRRPVWMRVRSWFFWLFRAWL